MSLRKVLDCLRNSCCPPSIEDTEEESSWKCTPENVRHDCNIGLDGLTAPGQMGIDCFKEAAQPDMPASGKCWFGTGGCITLTFCGFFYVAGYGLKKAVNYRSETPSIFSPDEAPVGKGPEGEEMDSTNYTMLSDDVLLGRLNKRAI